MYINDLMMTLKCWNILSRVGRFCVTYKTGFGLDDWIYYTLYIHTVRDYRQYSAIAILHTFQFSVTHALRFSVIISRILATDLSQSHCKFKSHLKYSFHGLITFDCHLQNSTQFLKTTNCFLGTSHYIASGRTSRKTPSSIAPYCFRRVYWSVP
jgi:hypothetical protein